MTTESLKLRCDVCGSKIAVKAVRPILDYALSCWITKHSTSRGCDQ
ncbi:MAG: hypothetical protein JWP74_1738 [Marmoricola sp.]|nr:hypothetical protein [Marmoricola sp.]